MKSTKYIDIPEDQFYEQFTPVKNHIDNNAGFDGCLFETYGEELEYAFAKSKEGNYVWTVLEIEGDLYYATGFHTVNRLGYIITEEPYEYEIDVKLD